MTTDLGHYLTARQWLNDIIQGMTVAWHVNEGLAPLIAQLKAAHPGIVIGTIGDAAHRNEASDHNPNAAGRVNAADPMLGPVFSASQAHALSRFLIADPRTHYVIWNHDIWTSETRAWKAYSGSDPHTNHVHLSVHDSAHTNTRPWVIATPEETDVNIDGLLKDANASKDNAPPDTPLGHYALSQQVEDGTDSDKLIEFYKAFANLGHLVVTLSDKLDDVIGYVSNLKSGGPVAESAGPE